MLHRAELSEFASPTPRVVKRLRVNAKQLQRIFVATDGMGARPHPVHVLCGY